MVIHTKYICFILLLVVLFTSCAGLSELWANTPPIVKEKAPGIINAIGRGDGVGALMESIDVVLILLGLKGLKKGVQVVKKKLVNPPENSASN